MAKSKLIDSPFKDLGSPVFGDRFVGRQGEVARLIENCGSRNFSILGLPKVGKTSLAYHSIIHLQKRIKSKEPLCVLMFNAGTCVEPNGFFKKLVKQVYGELKNTISTSNAIDDRNLDEQFGFVVSDDFELDAIETFFAIGIKSLAVNLVLIFDEFDKTRDIFLSNHFALLRAILCVPNIHGVIISKRSIYDIENWKNDSSSGPSNLFQLFDENTIHLEPFNDQDLEAYWMRLEPYFEEIDFPYDENYRNIATFYAGKHPHKLDMFNDANYDSFKRRRSLMTDEKIGSIMKSAFRAEFDVLHSVDLLDAAIQTIIGPVFDLNEEQVTMLKDYGFLREISEADKLRLIGTNMGILYQKGGCLKAYVASSDYCTLFMKKCFANDPEFWPKWSKTFRGLRKIVECFLIVNWGEDWYDQNIHELTEILKSIHLQKEKDEIARISVSPYVEYLNESLLGTLLNLYWEQVFNKLFSINKNDFFKYFNYLKKIRNHEAHNNDLFLSEEDRDTANSYLDEIERDVDKWLTTGNNQDLKLDVIISNLDNTVLVDTPSMPALEKGVKQYEGTIVLKSDMNDPNRIFNNIACSDFDYEVRIIDRSRYDVEEGDRVLFEVVKKGDYWVAIKVRKL